MLLTFFVFILGANAIGLIPIFEVLGLIDHFLVHAGRIRSCSIWFTAARRRPAISM